MLLSTAKLLMSMKKYRYTKKINHPQIQVPTQMQFVILFVGKLTKVMPPFPPPRKKNDFAVCAAKSNWTVKSDSDMCRSMFCSIG